MEAAERKTKGINKKGEPRKNANRKYRGASRKVEFECGHVGKGKFCHRCEQLKRGELIEKGDKLVPNPKWVSESKMVQHAKYTLTEDLTGMSKQRIIDLYLKKNNTTLGAFKKKLGGGK
jgi:hypothetical protein